MKYGFVYIWYDRKYKRYYVGCRWGSEDDGYICSSSWMKASYKKRPRDFKRRILARIYTDRKELHEEEYRWLSMMKQDELHGPRYYNIYNHHFNHWSTNDHSKEKIKQQRVGKKLSPEAVAKRTATRMANSGYKLSEKTKDKMSESRRGERNHFYGKHHSENTKHILSEKNKNKKLTQDTIDKRTTTIKSKGIKKTPEARQRISESLKLAWQKRKNIS